MMGSKNVLIDPYSLVEDTKIHDFEIVLAPDPNETYCQSKGSNHEKHYFNSKESAKE